MHNLNQRCSNPFASWVGRSVLGVTKVISPSESGSISLIVSDLFKGAITQNVRLPACEDALSRERPTLPIVPQAGIV
jgi:hypothetical protein